MIDRGMVESPNHSPIVPPHMAVEIADDLDLEWGDTSGPANVSPLVLLPPLSQHRQAGKALNRHDRDEQ